MIKDKFYKIKKSRCLCGEEFTLRFDAEQYLFK